MVAGRRILEHPILGKAGEAREVVIYVDGREVRAREGEPLLAAMLAEGILIQRYTRRFHQPRGMFCGIGRCTDCAVTVNGRPNVRSCMVPVEPGMVVDTRETAAEWHNNYKRDAGAQERPCVGGYREVDVLVVGTGPAGLAAATTAAKYGAKVLVVDENGRPGGQLFKQIHKFFGDRHHYAGVRGFDIGNRLLEEARSLGVEVLLETVAYGIFPEGVGIAGKHIGRTVLVRPRRVVLATGANENAVAFPGWTLPGVMTAGAVQTMVNLHRVLPGSRVLMVGSGNVGLIVSYQLLQAGARVEAVVEALPHVGGYGVHAAKVRRAGVPILTSHTVAAVEGRERVERARVRRVDDASGSPAEELVFDVDVVCLAVGLNPCLELAQIAGCRIVYEPALGGFVPWHDENMQTSVPGLYVAGDVAGVEEASVAMEEGRLAGVAVAESLALVEADRAAEAKRAIWENLDNLRSGPFGTARRTAKLRITGRLSGNSGERKVYSVQWREAPSAKKEDPSTLPDLPRGVRRAFIECYEEIPCNPCETACPKKAITVGEPISNLPRLDPALCTGCGACMAVCPGQAIFIVDTTSEQCDRVWLPWEYLPVPKAGQAVTVLGRRGETVCEGRVARVIDVPKNDRTSILVIEVPPGRGKDARSISRVVPR